MPQAAGAWLMCLCLLHQHPALGTGGHSTGVCGQTVFFLPHRPWMLWGLSGWEASQLDTDEHRDEPLEGPKHSPAGLVTPWHGLRASRQHLCVGPLLLPDQACFGR